MSKWSSAFRDSRWQKKRLEVMERDGWKCACCGKGGEGVTLNVHHLHYETGKAPWDYPDDMLVTWCEKCHKRMHELQVLLWKLVAGVNNPEGMMCTLIGYVHGHIGPCLHSGADYEQGYADCKVLTAEHVVAAMCAFNEVGGVPRRPL